MPRRSPSELLLQHASLLAACICVCKHTTLLAQLARCLRWTCLASSHTLILPGHVALSPGFHRSAQPSHLRSELDVHVAAVAYITLRTSVRCMPASELLLCLLHATTGKHGMHLQLWTMCSSKHIYFAGSCCCMCCVDVTCTSHWRSASCSGFIQLLASVSNCFRFSRLAMQAVSLLAMLCCV